MKSQSEGITFQAIWRRENLPIISLSQLIKNGGGLIGLNVCQNVLLLLLLLSALSDLATDRIPNGFVLLGIAAGIAASFLSGRGLADTLTSMFLAFLLMYPLYMIGALGAGDVKLFILIGSFREAGEFMVILAGAFVIGAGFSIVKLAAERNGRERFRYFFSYLADIVRTGHWKIYGENLRQDYHTYCKNKIHFAVPILLSTVCRIGGIF